MRNRILIRTATVGAAAALAISGAAGVAGAQEAPAGSIPTSTLGSLEHTPINQLINDPEQFFQTSLIIPGSLVLGSVCLVSSSYCPT